MKKSIFFKITLMILPILILLEGVTLFVTYRITYESTIHSNTKYIQNATKMAVEIAQFVFPDSDEDAEACSSSFESLCESYNVDYVFLVEADVHAMSEKYLAIGFGKGANKDAIETRYPGVTVYNMLDSDEIAIVRGEKESAVRSESNQFGDTIICYMPVSDYYSADDLKTVKLDKTYIVAAEMNISSIVNQFESRFTNLAIQSGIGTLLVLITIALILNFKIARPLRRISKKMNEFSAEKINSFEDLPVKGNDELANMSRSFNTMAHDIDSYIHDIGKLNKEKHIRDTELDIARNIQAGLLQPSFYKNQNVTINAIMRAAKNVGGDLYDYRVQSDGKVYFVIADVAGKGISGALFMSRAITLLEQYALLGYSPAQMMTAYNDTLAEHNPNGLFITTFAAVYDPETGELKYTNAGHNHPYVLSDTLIELSDTNGMAAGIFNGFVYSEESIVLKAGDVIFMYTDGVNECENKNDEFFGTEELEEELKRHIGTDCDTIVEDVLKRLEEFADGATQSDDTTIMTVKIAEKPIRQELTVPAKAEYLNEINEMIMNKDGLSEDMKFNLSLIAEEIFVNICSYAYPDKEGFATITLDVYPDAVTIIFTDNGQPFDPTEQVLEIAEYDHEHSIGGLGRFMTFSIADVYAYLYRDGKNILRITKYNSVEE